MSHDPITAPSHSDKRYTHTAEAGNKHIYGWVSSEIRQPAQNRNDAKRCVIV